MNDTYTTFEEAGIRIDRSAGDQQRAVCPRCSGERRNPNERDLSVNLVDSCWYCHHCQWDGRLGDPSEWKGAGRIERRRVEVRRIELPAHGIDADGRAYLRSRGITDAVAVRNRVTSRRSRSGDDSVIEFHYLLNGENTATKYRTVSRKDFAQTKGGAQILYKIDDIAGAESAIITEGEFDALSLEVAGYTNVVSVPGGSKALTFFETCKDQIAAVERWYIAVDSDPDGVALREELASRIGKDRCLLVDWPSNCKDANDVLVKFGADALRSCIDHARRYPIEGVVHLFELTDRVLALHDNGFPVGATCGLASLDENFTWHTPQLSIFTGIPGHGKSTLVDFIVSGLIALHQWGVVYFTPENRPLEIHVVRLLKQLLGLPIVIRNGQMDFGFGVDRASRNAIRAACEYLGRYVHYIRPEKGGRKLPTILQRAKQLREEYGVKMLVLDPWNWIEKNIAPGTSETNFVADQLTLIQEAGEAADMHTVIVAHPTKMSKDAKGAYEKPGLYDISGSANFYNCTDNGFVVHLTYDMNSPVGSPRWNTSLTTEKVKHDYYGRRSELLFHYDPITDRYADEGSEFATCRAPELWPYLTSGGGPPSRPDRKRVSFDDMPF